MRVWERCSPVVEFWNIDLNGWDEWTRCCACDINVFIDQLWSYMWYVSSALSLCLIIWLWNHWMHLIFFWPIVPQLSHRLFRTVPDILLYRSWDDRTPFISIRDCRNGIRHLILDAYVLEPTCHVLLMAWNTIVTVCNVKRILRAIKEKSSWLLVNYPAPCFGWGRTILIWGVCAVAR